MYQQGYRPPQQPPPDSEKKSAKAEWQSYSPMKKLALIALLFLLLLFVGFIISPDVGAWICVAEILAGAVIGVRALYRRRKDPETRKAEKEAKKRRDEYEKKMKVYIAKSGRKYHIDPRCGSMNRAKSSCVSLRFAKRHGYSRCSRCS